MSEQEFDSIPWQYGNKVRLSNGKDYFVADYRITVERTSAEVQDYWANHPEKVRPSILEPRK